MAFRRNPFDHLSGPRSAAVVVAHPDDETLWAGGTILSHPDWHWTILGLCRGSDPDRSARFVRALEALRAEGDLADLDDGPEQQPLDPALFETTCLEHLGDRAFDLVMTHGPEGEYTRHRRHEEVSRAVSALWLTGRLQARQMVLFAFEDGGRNHFPRPRYDAHFRCRLAPEVLEKKRSIITDIYGFAADSWEANAVSAEEACWSFESRDNLRRWLAGRGVQCEDSRSV